MEKQGTAKPVERLFPFVLRSRILLIGREAISRNKSRLHFVLITLDLSENSRAKILSDFAAYPVVQRYSSAELEKHFCVKGAKVVGFQKSSLAQSIYAELKQHRLNQPAALRRNDAVGKGEHARPGRSHPVPSPGASPAGEATER